MPGDRDQAYRVSVAQQARFAAAPKPTARRGTARATAYARREPACGSDGGWLLDLQLISTGRTVPRGTGEL